jgi:hypothetical protein
VDATYAPVAEHIRNAELVISVKIRPQQELLLKGFPA